MAKLQIDSYERAAIQGTARTGALQLAAFLDGVRGERPFNAQIRLLLELIRRNRINFDDLREWAARSHSDKQVLP